MNVKITFFYKKTRRNFLVGSSQVSDDDKESNTRSASKVFVSRYPRHTKTKKRLFQTNFVWNSDLAYSNDSFSFHIMGEK